MEPRHLPAAHRSLLDRPQRFGIVPTFWFWNNRERQLLLLPLAAITVLPAAYVFFAVVLRLQLSVWLAYAFACVSLIALMGLVERHLRHLIDRLPLEERLDHVVPPRASSRVLPTLFAGLCATGALYMASDLAAVHLVLILGVVLASCWLPQTRHALRRLAHEHAKSRELPSGTG